MLIASGTILVLVTWAACAVALISLGLLPAAAVTARPGHAKNRNAASVVRRAIWWGLLTATVFAYLVNLAQPLHSGTTAAVGITLVALFGIPGWLVVRRREWQRSLNHGWPFILLWVALVFSLVYLAATALGPVTNYDSGLYHLGSIKYAAEYATMPGLANLYYALAYSNAEFPLAALMGNGPWQAEGYRLLNGLVMALAVVELGLRLHRRRLSPGFFVLLAGILVAWVPMVALSDYWVTSPTQDSSVFVLNIVATAYLVDAAAGARNWVGDVATACVLALLLVLFRPTMVAFAAGTVLVAIVLAWRRRAHVDRKILARSVAFLAVAAMLAAAAATARDYLLSGWLQFPLSIHAFDVPWRAADPTMDRVATMGFHRNPADLWGSTAGWSWVGPWLANRLSQWETYEFLGLVAVACLLTHLANMASRPNVRWRAMLLAWAPSLLATVVWWAFTPPSYRFAWGSIFTLATIPIGWSLWLLSKPGNRSRIPSRMWRTIALASVAVPILVVTVYSAVARFHVDDITAPRQWRLGIELPYAVAPVVDVPIVEVPTNGGLVLTQPTQSDQCWDHFPLCTPRPNPSLRLRGSDTGSGFLP